MKNRKQRVELMVDLIKNKCIGSQEDTKSILVLEAIVSGYHPN